MYLQFGFSWVGAVVFLLPMAINIVYFMREKDKGTLTCSETDPMQKPRVSAWEAVESLFRVLYALCMAFLVPRFQMLWLYPAVLFFVLYHAAWIRCLMCGAAQQALFDSFLGVPQALAVFPVLYYLFAALWLSNIPALLCMLVFGGAHNVVTARQKRRADAQQNHPRV